MTRWVVHHVADSFEELKKLPDSVVDVVLTDPPFSEHVQANMSSGTAMKKQVDGGKGGGIPRIELPFEALQSYEFAADLTRVAKRWAISFCAVEDFGLFRAVVGQPQWIRGGIWYKPNSMGQLTGDRPANAYEGLAIMHRKVKKQWNGRGSYGYWSCDDEAFFPSEEAHFQCNGTRGEKGRHPNQKPLDLCLELVAKFTNRGETVLDPFAGSGRIGEACLMLGRSYVGFERDAEWVEKARDRLSKTTPEVVKDEDCMRLCAAPKKVKAA
jgi:site-specific DNA-methyltransferase (adenine-specific)